MRIVGFNFTKISIEKKKEIEPKDELKVNTDISIKELKEIKSLNLKIKEEIIGVDYSFKVIYDPSIAIIDLEGKILFSSTSKEIKEILNEWKNKKMPENFKVLLFNFILKKSNLKALELEEDLNLPLHFPMPSLKKEEK